MRTIKWSVGPRNKGSCSCPILLELNAFYAAPELHPYVTSVETLQKLWLVEYKVDSFLPDYDDYIDDFGTTWVCYYFGTTWSSCWLVAGVESIVLHPSDGVFGCFDPAALLW